MDCIYPHKTRGSAYRSGCRCAECCAANSAEKKQYRDRRAGRLAAAPETPTVDRRLTDPAWRTHVIDAEIARRVAEDGAGWTARPGSYITSLLARPLPKVHAGSGAIKTLGRLGGY